MFFKGLVFGSSVSGTGIGLGSNFVGDLIGDACRDCACVNVLMRCAITELRIGFSGVFEFDLRKCMRKYGINLGPSNYYRHSLH